MGGACPSQGRRPRLWREQPIASPVRSTVCAQATATGCVSLTKADSLPGEARRPLCSACDEAVRNGDLALAEKLLAMRGEAKPTSQSTGVKAQAGRARCWGVGHAGVYFKIDKEDGSLTRRRGRRPQLGLGSWFGQPAGRRDCYRLHQGCALSKQPTNPDSHSPTAHFS